MRLTFFLASILSACSLSFDPAELACPCATGFECVNEACVQSGASDSGVDSGADSGPSICETPEALVCDDFEGESVLAERSASSDNEFSRTRDAYRGENALNADQVTPGQEFRAEVDIDSESSDLWVRFAFRGEPDGTAHSIVSIAVTDAVDGRGRFYFTVAGTDFTPDDWFAIVKEFPPEDEVESEIGMVASSDEWRCLEFHVHEGDGDGYAELFVNGSSDPSAELQDQTLDVTWDSAAIDMSYGVTHFNADYDYDDFIVSEARVRCP